MRTRRSLWTFLAVVFCFIGTCIVALAVRSVGDLADATLLVGATVTALAVFALLMAVEEHRRLKAAAQAMNQMRPARRRPLLNSKPVVKIQETEGKPSQVAPLTSNR